MYRYYKVQGLFQQSEKYASKKQQPFPIPRRKPPGLKKAVMMNPA